MTKYCAVLICSAKGQPKLIEENTPDARQETVNLWLDMGYTVERFFTTPA
jgi:hypothetical protein